VVSSGLSGDYRPVDRRPLRVGWLLDDIARSKMAFAESTLATLWKTFCGERGLYLQHVARLWVRLPDLRNRVPKGELDR
jgi:hypothetical protein